MPHLEGFAEYLTAACGHDRLSSVVPRDVSGWRDHLASVSGFLARMVAQGCGPRAGGQPGGRVRTLAVPPPGPWALIRAQVRCRAEVA